MAIMLYWFWIVEGSERLPNVLSVRRFIKENNVLFKDLLQDHNHDFFRREEDWRYFSTAMQEFVMQLIRIL